GFSQLSFFHLRFCIGQSFGGGIELVVCEFKFLLLFRGQLFDDRLGIGGCFRFHVCFGNQFVHDRFVRRWLFLCSLYFGSRLGRSFFCSFLSVSGFLYLCKFCQRLFSRGFGFGSIQHVCPFLAVSLFPRRER